MDEATRRRLNALNREFYRVTATEFDATRGQAWAGWLTLLPYLTTPLRVLDVGCGNGRFGVFLAAHLTGSIHYHGIDNSAALLAHAADDLQATPLTVTLTEQDLVEQPLPSGEYDLVVLFGVLHHLPGAAQRLTFMQQLAAQVASGGYLAFAAWCFYESPRLRERIVPWGADFTVEAQDYLLDWRRGERALRYCHYVDEAEHQALLTATGLTPRLTYRADGQDGQMNRYSLLQRA
jgi:SAM-dependent methyltransferase